MVTERWRPIEGFEALYEVSDFGNVRSLRSGKLLKPGRTSSGHFTVALGRGNSRYVHVLVARAFIGPAPAGHEVCHRDDDGGHNRADNLFYGTRSENGRHKKYNKGCANFVLAPEQVSRIKARLRSSGRGIGAALAAEFGVAQSTISAIKTGRFHVDVA